MNLQSKIISKNFKEIISNIESKKELFDRDLFLEGENLYRSFDSNIDQILEENRVLRIGIVGEVKAGKSSFINSLVFEGKDVLPKAATPMTAALTKINYGDKFSAKIIFYNDKDWEIIAERSKEYDRIAKQLKQEYLAGFRNRESTIIPSDESIEKYIRENVSEVLLGCKEITTDVIANNLNPEEYFGRIEPIDYNKDLNGFFQILEEYVGSRGKYTPLVRHTELTLNISLLKDIEIIDTPGINDPIISRGATTRNFLDNCDVIFFLSYSGEFLSSQDINFLVTTIPDNNISEVVLIGSRFDDYVLDDKGTEKDLVAAVRRSQKCLSSIATDNLKSKKHFANNSNVLEKLGEKIPPLVISSAFYVIGKKGCQNLTEQEKVILNNYKKRFVNFDDNPESLIQFSRIDYIRDKTLFEIKKKKDEIIKDKVNKALNHNVQRFLNLLERINIDIINRHDSLRKFDKNELEQKYNKLKQELNDVRSDIKITFESHINSVNKEIAFLKHSCEKAQLDFAQVDVKKRTDQNEWTTGWLFWKKTHVRNVTVSYVDVNQIVNNLQSYILFLKQKVLEQSDKVLDIANLKQQLKKAVIGVFDLSSSNFKESEIIGPIEIVLGKIIIPKFSFKREDYERKIIEEFSTGIVEGMGIHTLTTKQGSVLNNIFCDLSIELDNFGMNLETKLSVQSSEFVDDIQKKVSKTVEAIKGQIDEKELYCSKYEKFERDINLYKKNIIKMIET